MLSRFVFTIILFFAIIAFALTGCSNSDNKTTYKTEISSEKSTVKDKSGRKPVIGATFLGPSEFPAAIMKKMVEEAKKKDITLYVYDGKDIVEEQISNIKDMIQKKVDVIILNPVDANGCIECVDLANKAGIPILGVNAMVNTEKLLTYVGSNDLEAGEIVMKYIAEKIEGNGEIVIMNGVKGQSSQLQRTQGILNILRSYPNIKILAEESANWSRNQGYELMKNWNMRFGRRIKAVVSQNDEMALGAIKYMQEMELDIPIIGIDAIPDALTAVKAGKLDATVFQDAEGQAIMSLDLAIKIYNSDSYARTYFIPFRLITKENIDQYLKIK